MKAVRWMWGTRAWLTAVSLNRHPCRTLVARVVMNAEDKNKRTSNRVRVGGTKKEIKKGNKGKENKKNKTKTMTVCKILVT